MAQSSFEKQQPLEVQDVAEQEERAGFIQAFGMYWARDKVYWSNNPKLLGYKKGGQIVDFSKQNSVYLLHDVRAVVYVGRVTDQGLGVRLRQHIDDRFNGRWDRFSWFGIYPISEDGTMRSDVGKFDVPMLMTMEALLIEGLEPPQNRKRGDDFSRVEFIQAKDRELERREMVRLIDEFKLKLQQDQ